MRRLLCVASLLTACHGSGSAQTAPSQPTPVTAGSASAPAAPSAPASTVAAAPNGIEFPAGYQSWATVGVSHRVDNGTLRVILGNDAAIAAIREGHTTTWPDGAALGKVVWKEAPLDLWDKAIVPSTLVHAEFMFKDSTRFPETGGWGFARWKGMEQTPYGEDASFVNECWGCHQPAKDRDFVFTLPAPLPR